MLRPGLLVDVGSTPDGAVLLDTRLALTGPSGREQYDAGHLPGAAYVDIDADLADAPGAGGRHPLPDPVRFVEAMRRAGVRRDSTVVVYDAGSATAAGRLWWLLRDHGHDDVLVLDGGLAAWTAAGRPVSTEPATPARATGSAYPATSRPSATTRPPPCPPSGILIDVRAPARFTGEAEPIDPVAGHVPGAVSAPLTGNTDEIGRFLPPAELRARFASLGVGDGVPVAAYCGSGVTACQTIIALRLSGLDPDGRAALYPGSWSGWITDPTRPVATGP